ncbi:MAG: hypothetical protein JW951_08130, partial [Lentisphaerae bacterium]|nr:hypothetical protein [Lentisphaerota bacterium]
PLGIAGVRLEQVVVNLGIRIADAAGAAGTLRVLAGPPAEAGCLAAGAPCAGVIVLTASGADLSRAPCPLRPVPPSEEPGVIVSVVQSLLTEAGGFLEILADETGRPAFRVALPPVSLPALSSSARVPEEMIAYIRDWTVLVAAGSAAGRPLERRLRAIGVRVETAGAIADALARIEESRRLDAVVIHAALLRNVAAGLLRAVLKLRPDAAVVVMSEPEPRPAPSLAEQVVFTPESADPDSVILALIEAKGCAVHRRG